MMKKIIFISLIFLIIGCVYAEDFSKVTVNGNEFEIPNQYSLGDKQKNGYVYHDLRTFAILCVDDYIISNYGGYYKISDSVSDLSIDSRPARLLTVYNTYISKNVSYLYFPVNQSVYCICFQGNDVNASISHIVESAPASDMTSDSFYGILSEAYEQYEDRAYLDRVSTDYSNSVSQKNQHDTHSNNQLITWYLLTHGGR